jgi:hypothetical protein
VDRNRMVKQRTMKYMQAIMGEETTNFFTHSFLLHAHFLPSYHHYLLRILRSFVCLIESGITHY